MVKVKASGKIIDPGRRFGERKIYVAWEYCTWAKSWMDMFHEKLAPIGYDKSDNPVETLLHHDIPAGSIVTVELRDLQAKATDVVVVLTSAYILKQQNQIKAGRESELSIFIERKEEDDRDSLTLWLAPLESLKLRYYQVGEKRLDRYSWWHWLKEEQQHFTHYGPADHRYTTGFIQELDAAIDRLMAHVPRLCQQCACKTTDASSDNIDLSTRNEN